ncbi:MAG: site-specific DNA-methyltransferase [Candidatus Sericytochromatia bacterium]|nr:site-specific DNA-methyltransferase [Candidatus Sericytochromatia bacterium]
MFGPVVPADLVWCGDNLPFLASLPRESVRVAYLDPPYLTGETFRVGSVVAYADPDADPDGWLRDFEIRCRYLEPALLPGGTVLVQLDHRMAHAARFVLETVFPGGFLNEIVWAYGAGALAQARRQLARKHDILLWFAKGPGHVFHPPRSDAPSAAMEQRWRRHADDRGRVTFGKLAVEGTTYARMVRQWSRRHGRSPAADDVAFTLGGHLLRSVWTDIPEIRNSVRYRESTGYPTQKPLALLERLIAMATHPGDLVVDPYAGSGTTLLAAHRLGRRSWGADAGQVAQQTMRVRLADTGHVFLGAS